MEVLRPNIKRMRSLSPVWIIPVVTLLTGIWLALHSWQKRGADVEIIFNEALGITVGQTEVRLKDVPVGKVTHMRLSEDLSKVIVRVALNQQINKHLSENSRFWLVRPRISTSGISNLGTLISGVYIVMDPGKPGEYHTTFEGLEEPPAFKSDDQGTQFILLAEQLGSLDIGSPVYYRNVRVGEVTGYKFGDSGSNIEIRVFIEAPHDKLVYTRTHFWNVSGFDVTIGAEGIKANVASIASLISGGVAFENPVGFGVATGASSNHRFNLYADKESIVDGRFTLQYYYLLKFSHSVRGLSVGAPVEFRGIKIGEVLEVKLDAVTREEGSLHVIVAIEPQRLIADNEPSREQFDDTMADLVKKGLRAQIRNSNMITGSRYIALGFPAVSADAELVRLNQFSEIPTQDNALENIDQQLAEVANKISNLPLDKIGQNLGESLQHLNNILGVFDNKQTAEELHKTLANVSSASAEFQSLTQQVELTFAQLETTMASLDSLVAPDSNTQYQIDRMLRSVQDAADTLEALMQQLHDKPDALIFGGDR